MKKYLIATFFLIVLSEACTKETNRDPEKGNNVPEAFQDESIIKDISSFKRGYESVSDKLYSELLKKDETLRALEENIRKLENDLYYDNIDLNKFLSNNESYYSDIKVQAENVKDTLLKGLLVQKINESEHNFGENIKDIKTLKDILNYKIEVLKDYKTAMKIILTEQSMHVYQNNFKQDSALLHSLIQRYEGAIKDIQSKIEE